MKAIVSLVLSTCFFYTLVAQENFRTSIVGGTPADIKDMPWTAQIYFGTNKVCTGVIINQNWILTAGHCVDEYVPDMYSVVVGSTVSLKYATHYQKSKVKRIVGHLGFFRKDFEDLALLELDKPITYDSFIKNIPLLPDSEEKNMFVGGTLVKAAGWGVHNYPHDSDTLYTTDLVTLDTTESIVSLFHFNNRKKIFTTSTKRKGFPCNGDSGGPLTYTTSDQNTYLAGIISTSASLDLYGTKCTDDLFTYTNICYFKNWIQEVINSKKTYFPVLFSLNHSDTLATCDGLYAPEFRFYNNGIDPIDYLNIRYQFAEVGATTVPQTKTLVLKNSIQNNWITNVLGKDLGFQFPVEVGKTYQFKLELLDEQMNSIHYSLNKAIEVKFYVKNGKRILLESKIDETKLSKSPLFNLYTASTTKEAFESFSSVSDPIYSRLYRNQTTSFLYTLKDSICVVEGCYRFSYNQSDIFLYEKTSASIDTLFLQRPNTTFKYFSYYNNFCVSDAPCDLGTKIFINFDKFTLCHGDSISLSPGDSSAQYEYTWFSNQAILSHSKNYQHHSQDIIYLEVKNPLYANCKTYASKNVLFSNTRLPLLYEERDTIFAYLPDTDAKPLWFVNDVFLKGYNKMYYVPRLGDEVYIRYNRNVYDSTCISYLRSPKTPPKLEFTATKTLENAPELSVYPIPSTEVIHVGGLQAREVSYIITNCYGVDIKSGTVNSRNDTNEIKLNEIPRGMYILQLYTNEEKLKTLPFTKL